ncbi:MAG: AzlC family ABC transporter permease [Pseudomonadota bacterium]
MTTLTPAFRKGFLAGLPFVLVIIPFGMLFGVLATEAGLSVVETMAMTSLVIAGAAQFTALQLMQEGAPVAIALLASLAVNLRMAMYSASMAPHVGAAPMGIRMVMSYFMVDQTYALAIARYQDQPELSLNDKVGYFFGAVSAICPLWYFSSYLGAVLGAAIPPEFALDFAVPITFIAIVAPSLRSLAHVAAALVSIVLALLLAWIPYALGLMIAAGVAMVVGAQVEIWQERRAK